MHGMEMCVCFGLLTAPRQRSCDKHTVLQRVVQSETECLGCLCDQCIRLWKAAQSNHRHRRENGKTKGKHRLKTLEQQFATWLKSSKAKVTAHSPVFSGKVCSKCHVSGGQGSCGFGTASGDTDFKVCVICRDRRKARHASAHPLTESRRPPAPVDHRVPVVPENWGKSVIPTFNFGSSAAMVTPTKFSVALTPLDECVGRDQPPLSAERLQVQVTVPLEVMTVEARDLVLAKCTVGCDLDILIRKTPLLMGWTRAQFSQAVRRSISNAAPPDQTDPDKGNVSPLYTAILKVCSPLLYRLSAFPGK